MNLIKDDLAEVAYLCIQKRIHTGSFDQDECTPIKKKVVKIRVL